MKHVLFGFMCFLWLVATISGDHTGKDVFTAGLIIMALVKIGQKP